MLTDEESGIDLEWFKFINWLVDTEKEKGLNPHISELMYASQTSTWFRDYLRCMNDARSGVPRAIKYRDDYMLWKLTK